MEPRLSSLTVTDQCGHPVDSPSVHSLTQHLEPGKRRRAIVIGL